MRRFFSMLLLLSALAYGCNTTTPAGPAGGSTGGTAGTGTGGAPATGGTETGNTAAIAIRVVGYEANAAALTVGTLQITRADVVLDRLRFRPFASCDDDLISDIRFDGPFAADLLNPAPLAGLEDITVPSGLYCRIELTLKKFDGESDDELTGRSILIEGARSDGVPFQMTTEVDEDFTLENETSGFTIASEGGLQVFFIAFDLARWFDGIDLFTADLSDDGAGHPIILINDDSNEAIQEHIEDNLKLSADLFKDADHNEHLDPEEEDDSLASGSFAP